MFYNVYAFMIKSQSCRGVEAVIRAYKLYLEQCPVPPGEQPVLALTRAWTLVRFVDSGMLESAPCSCCGGSFIAHAHQPLSSFVCSLCQPPSRAIKKRKLSDNLADMFPQLLNEQEKRVV